MSGGHAALCPPYDALPIQLSNSHPLSSPGLTGRSSTPRPLGSIRAASGILDRPVEPGDDIEQGDATPRSRGTIRARVLHQSCRLEETRARGTPDAGRTRMPCVQKKVHIAHASNTGQPEQPAFPAQWVTAYTCSPRCAGLFSHRRFMFVTRSLIPASGDRDRTISPSALRASSLRTSRPSHPAPRQVTIGRNAPLAGRDGRNIRLIFVSEKENYFREGP